MFGNLFISQCIAHFLADFTFQPQRWCEKKNTRPVTIVHFYHALVVFGLSTLFFLIPTRGEKFLPILLFASIIATTHFVIDVIKSYLFVKKTGLNFLFITDQVIHILIISLITFSFYKGSFLFPCESVGYYNLPESAHQAFSVKKLFILLSLYLCTNPANVFINNIMGIYNITTPNTKRNNDLPNAGKLIGIIERTLSFILITFDHFSIVGFIIAAKSILRFRDTDTAKTEYLLIGSLLSFGIAILLGIIYHNINEIIFSIFKIWLIFI
ncbi:MAG: DUF3307 domain-containing protein [Dysgonamonadaceae bacterium]|jgi:hypothetical protein|nr:DUF3307 domain-containing protein [Dysgonamonadaceae bacterium]